MDRERTHPFLGHENGLPGIAQDGAMPLPSVAPIRAKASGNPLPAVGARRLPVGPRVRNGLACRGGYRDWEGDCASVGENCYWKWSETIFD